VRSVPLRDGSCRVAAEHFAIAADVHRWLGRIGDADYTCDTPDGRSRSRADSGARLARMVCADRETLGDRDVTAMAEHIAHTQARQITLGIRQVMRRLGVARPHVALAAGSGAFVARAAADGAGLAARDLAGELGSDAARAVPAAAVARLLAETIAAGRG
jgi:(4-(4-[2-(gamma-L-glutamylamino)ethyl]phenoxymethyl)furan-2-yl)methanamine synthase